MAKTLTWGILGDARIARGHMIPAIETAKHSNLAAIASRSNGKGELPSGVRRYDTYEALLYDPDIDAVYIPLPNSLHCEWSIKAMNQGKHVLCEKPIALNAEQCSMMISAAERNGVILMEAYMYRFGIKRQKIMSLINDRTLGKIKSVHVHFGYNLNWASQVRQNSALGGGSMYDIGCYCVDMINSIMCIERASFTDASAAFKQKNGTDERVGAWLRYDNGVVCTLECWFDAPAHQELAVVGEKGILTALEPFRGSAEPICVTLGDGTTQRIETKACDPYTLQIEAFSDAVIKKENRLMPLKESLANMRLLDFIRGSAITYSV